MGRAPCSCSGSHQEGSRGSFGLAVPFGGIASRSSVGAVYGGQRQSYASWCLNGQLERNVQRGEMTREDALRQLEAMPRGEPVYVGGRQDFVSKGCTAGEEAKIAVAVNLIHQNIGQLPRACTANTTNSCLAGGNGLCFGGHSVGSPQVLVRQTLNSSTFRIHCYSFCLVSPFAYTNCGQWSQRNQDIYVCSKKIQDLLPMQLACVIAHEIMHVLGADENAAFSMVQGTVPWGCP